MVACVQAAARAAGATHLLSLPLVMASKDPMPRYFFTCVCEYVLPGLGMCKHDVQARML